MEKEKKTILIADDVEGVRIAFSTVLGELGGYRVFEAQDGLEAVQMFTQFKDEISLVILDVNMPERGGKWAAQQISQLKSETVVVLMSGYNDEATEGIPFLKKPFDVDDLLKKVEEWLK